MALTKYPVKVAHVRTDEMIKKREEGRKPVKAHC